MIQNETKSPEILKAERQVEQAKARLAEAKRKESAKKRLDITVRRSRQSGQFRASVPVAQSHSDLA